MGFALVATIGFVVVVIFGVAFLFAPEPTAALYGISGWDAGTILVARLFGVSLLTIGAAVAAVRSTTDAELQRRFARYLAAASLVGVVISGYGALTGAGNALLWTVVVIYAFFVYAWGHIAFRG